MTTSLDKVLYTAKAHTTGGREGTSRTDDGLLDIGVASADGVVQWGRTLARSALSDVTKSPFVHVIKGRSVAVKLSRKILYELDGGDRAKAKTFRVDIQPDAVTVRVPAASK